MNGRDLGFLRIVGFGLVPVDLVRFFEHIQREIAQVLLQCGEPTPDRSDAPQTRGPDASVHVHVEEFLDVFRSEVARLSRRPWAPRITSGLNLADEEPLPTCFLRLGDA
jgi:hypothetical protein